MRTSEFRSSALRLVLEQNSVCTFAQLAQALGTPSRVTVFRKLAELGYLTSYSHRGKYYALKSTCQFESNGLWSHRGVWFSIYGTLLDTCLQFVRRAPQGYSAQELSSTLHVQTRQPLLRLLHKRQIARAKIGGRLIYLTPDAQQRQRQIRARCQGAPPRAAVSGEALAAQIETAIVFFFGLLNERQQQLFAALEVMRAGAAADTHVATLLGVDPLLVANARSELLRAALGHGGALDRDESRAPLDPTHSTEED